MNYFQLYRRHIEETLEIFRIVVCQLSKLFESDIFWKEKLKLRSQIMEILLTLILNLMELGVNIHTFMTFLF